MSVSMQSNIPSSSNSSSIGNGGSSSALYNMSKGRGLTYSPSNRYTVSALSLGEGSTGRVVIGECNHTGALKAIKLVNKSQPYMKDEALKEIEFLSQVSHENIITVEALEEDDQYLYLVFDYFEERDVYSYIQRNGKFSEEEAFVLFKQMVDALEACHSASICHHDFKLENCVMDKDHRLKLIDFAYAIKIPKERTKEYIVKYNGSPAYSAPEILYRKPHTESVDIFGLGTCLYYMISACFPFCDEDSTTFEELCLNVRAFNLDFVAGVSSEVKDLITKLLHKDIRLGFSEIRKHPWWSKHDIQKHL